MVWWLRLCFPVLGLQVRSLVGELRFHMPLDQKVKQKQYCNKFNKNFKNGSHKKKKNLKDEEEEERNPVLP